MLPGLVIYPCLRPYFQANHLIILAIKKALCFFDRSESTLVHQEDIKWELQG